MNASVESTSVAEHQSPNLHYEVLNDPDLRMRYVQLTDELIFKTQQNQTDHMIFLDKSARPVSWLTRSLWPLLAEGDADGNIPPLPRMSFLNIDREQWEPIVGRSEDKSGHLDVGAIPEDALDDLRTLFHTGEGDILSGKNIMVVDEVKASGDTLLLAEGVLKRAFSDAHVQGVHWMLPETKITRRGGRINGEVPVWYSDERTTGRLVGDRNSAYYRAKEDPAQRAGALWLSAPFRNGSDTLGLQLKKETQMIADEIRSGELPVFPYYEHDDFEERVETFNGHAFRTSPRQCLS